jgi:uncharacterized repeat protein (TIGR03803 family)
MTVRSLARQVVCTAAAVIFTIASASRVYAQATVSVIHQYPSAENSISGLTRAANGDLYGILPVTLFSGGPGAIFSIGPHTNDPVTFTIVHTFTPEEGTHPVDRLTLAADGRLYGVTSRGGAGGLGTLFRLEADHSVTVIHAFTEAETNEPLGPRSGVIQAADGSFYGVLPAAGPIPERRGALYRIDLAGVFSIVHSFAGGLEGQNPAMRLTLGPDGSLFGVTPRSTLVASFNGTVFRYTPGVGLSTLHNFSSAEFRPSAPLIVTSDGNLYGTTAPVVMSAAGATVFKVGPSTAFTTLHDFAVADGTQVRASLVEGPDGNLYGTASGGGSAGLGTVFRVSPTGAFQVVHNFSNARLQARQTSLLLLQPDARLLGVGSHSGTFGLFRVATDGTYTPVPKVLPAMRAADAMGGFVEFNGHLISAAFSGGIYGYGALSRREANGDFTDVHAFSFGDGAQPGSLVIGPDGNLYGTTMGGGAAGCGTAFRMSGAYIVTTVHHSPAAPVASRQVD